ncbi:MAG TPA: hypothetical protein ENO22_05625 [candidate division Zixibacteria bacterium]|nr:hypothetical protein [candidate division Zixibacteria bacterium]
MSEREQIIEEARSFLGVPFQHRGRSRSGLDCVGLLELVGLAVFGNKIELGAYPRHPSSRQVFEQINKYADRIEGSQARPGDLVLMNYGGRSTHFGILSDKGVINASAIEKKVVEQPLFLGRIVAYYKIRGVR